MLQILEEKDFDQYINLAYDISLDMSRTSFPVYTDGVKHREDFIRCCQKGMGRDDEEILLFIENGIVEGVIHYYVLEDDCYIGVNFISIWKRYAKALEELFGYWEVKYSGYSWNIYFPEENTDAIGYMRSKGHKASERSVVDLLFFKEYELQPENGDITHIDFDNYNKFADIHRLSEADMYWTSERIMENLADWEIFVSEGKGAVYYNGKGGDNLEIFGMDFQEGAFDMNIARSLLAACLNHAKKSGAKSMYFFNDPDIHKITVPLGFHCITVAHFFTGMIGRAQ